MDTAESTKRCVEQGLSQPARVRLSKQKARVGGRRGAVVTPRAQRRIRGPSRLPREGTSCSIFGEGRRASSLTPAPALTLAPIPPPFEEARVRARVGAGVRVGVTAAGCTGRGK